MDTTNINKNLYINIMTNHKQKIGEELFDFLFLDVNPLIISEKRLLIAVDTFSLLYLDNNSDHYLSFKDTCAQILLNNDFYLNFIDADEADKFKPQDKSSQNSTQNNSQDNLFNNNQSDNQDTIPLNPHLNNNEFIKNNKIEKQSNAIFQIDNEQIVDVNEQTANTYNQNNNDYNNQTFNSSQQQNINNPNDDIEVNNKSLDKMYKNHEVNDATYKDTKLSNNMTFNNFFYSYENKQIIDACKLIINNINDPQFNPLFIFGRSGIGKTHILNAIGNELYEAYPNKNVLYLHSNTFVEEYTSLFTGGINNTNKIEEFKNKYDDVDILLVDDIQHLELKEGSLAEFFGIFEKMRNNNKMIIIVSDKPPQQINFEDRLITRFLSGLTCEMKIPDTNTKKEIFQYHAQKRHFLIDDDAVSVFTKNSENVRSLLGYLNAITLYSISNDIDEMRITKEIAYAILNKNSGVNQEITDTEIIKIIADFYKIKQSDIRGRKRTKEIVNARHFAAYFLRRKLRQKHTKIAYTLGFKDHTAAINAIRAAEVKSTKPDTQADFEKLNNILNNY